MIPKVSIVLPNYNYARYLDERIQSLLNQTYRDFELIILDDASQDNSIEVIEKYTADPRVKTKYFSENSGLTYKRWNDGADIAQGEYLLIAGADDSCHPILVEKLVETLDNNSNVGLAFCQSWQIDSEGKNISSLKKWTNDLNQERWNSNFIDAGKNELKYLILKNTIPNASAVLMRRNIFIEAGKFDVQMRLAADWLLWVKMLEISDIAFLAEPLNYFRHHEGTVTTKAIKSGLNIEEDYQVQKYLITNPNLGLCKEIIDKASDIFAESWVQTVVDNLKSRVKIDLSRQIRIYQIAHSIDPKITKRLIKKFSHRFFNLMRSDYIYRIKR